MTDRRPTAETEAPTRRGWIRPLLYLQAVIGFLIALSMPNLLNAIHRGKSKRTMSDLRTIGTAVESYQVDTGAPPPVRGERLEVAALESRLVPTYIRELPRNDPWGRPYLWSCAGDEYSIVSAGKDARVDVAYDVGATTSFDADIYYSDGSFTVYPEGTMN